MTALSFEKPRSSSKIDSKYTRSKGSGGNFEMMAWLFMRISGVVLIVLIFTHLFTNLLVGEGVSGLDFGFVAGKWANPVWQFWDLTMLWLAMLHGTNGVRTIINDYTEKDATRRWLKLILYIAAVVIVVLGTLVIFTFEPCMLAPNGEPLPGAFCP
ncbi:succinate dehydrogenase hydrophobic membrane anchor subunit [Micrococcoides hystricis]|uniref:Succinate dehydrogenase hydrophobic membrane anchor subunit n=1 Tax=Micrococcoides hystricis TaxID=1572761 RepID=A0ABV6P954_9MICC